MPGNRGSNVTLGSHGLRRAICVHRPGIWALGVLLQSEDGSFTAAGTEYPSEGPSLSPKRRLYTARHDSKGGCILLGEALSPPHVLASYFSPFRAVWPFNKDSAGLSKICF